MKHVSLAVDAEGVALITLDHATESVNLVTPEWLDEMDEAIAWVTQDAAIKGAVITSAKPSFMAGADLKFMASFYGSMTPAEVFKFSQRATAMHRRIETCGKPVVAAINGLALGGGYELALACHYRILTDDPKARLGLPEVTVGLLAGSGGTQRLPRMIGVEAALPLLIDGTILKPAEALKRGLTDAVVPAGELLAVARSYVLEGRDPVRPWDRKGFAMPESDGLLKPATAGLFAAWSARIAAKTRHNYPAPIAILTAVFEGVQVPFDKGLVVESRQFAALLTGRVAHNIIQTGFIVKGEADKLVNRPQGVPKTKVKKLGVLGAGLMGAGIAYAAARAGIEVVLLDANRAQVEQGVEKAAGIAKKSVTRGDLSPADAERLLGRIVATSEYADLAEADLIVEAVFEDRQIKAKVTRQAEAVIRDAAIFVTNTSTLPITGLAEASLRPDQFIGLHFFSPVERMALVEVICGTKTSDETLAKALDFVQQLRKTPIVVNDSRGFYTSRVFQTFIHEGAAMLGEGVAPALIENAAKAAGFPVGPLTLLDETTIDLPLKIVEESIAEVGDAYHPPCGTAVMRRMRDEFRRSGRKSGGGFYAYQENGTKHLWPGLVEAFPQKTQPDVGELSERFLVIQAVESLRCLEENVLRRRTDGDLGSILGWGFPAWTGGTLLYIETVGADNFVATCQRLIQQYGARFSVPAGFAELLRS